MPNFIKYLKISPVILLLISFVSCDNSESNNEPAETNEVPAKDNGANTQRTIVFFGNSLTAGYGLDPSEAFPALIREKIDSLDMRYQVINAGVSGETTAGGSSRVDWILKNPVDIFVLELGANDGLRGIPIAETKRNLQAIIDKVHAKYPEAKIVLAGMQIPPNMGKQYAEAFKKIYPDLAQENNIPLIPFLLKDVGGEIKLNQQDGIHPTAEGQEIVAANVWEVLKSVVN